MAKPVRETVAHVSYVTEAWDGIVRNPASWGGTPEVLTKAASISNLAPPAPNKPKAKVEPPDADLEFLDLETGYHWRVSQSRLLAHDEAGASRPRWLYATPNGRYFKVVGNKIWPLEDRPERPRGPIGRATRPRGRTPWAVAHTLHPDHDHSGPAELEAARLWQHLPIKVVPFHEAFPNVAQVVEEA